MKTKNAQTRTVTSLAAITIAVSLLVPALGAGARAASPETQPLSSQAVAPARPDQAAVPAVVDQPTAHRPFSVQSPWAFGDWNGLRTRLQQKGVDFTLKYCADLQRNTRGGAKVGNAMWGRLTAAVEINLEKAAALPGARIYISGLDQSGGNINSFAGAYTSMSSILGANTTRLDQLFFEQTIADGNFMYRVGQVAGIDEFGQIDYGDYFLNLELAYTPKLEFVTNIPYGAGSQLGGLIRAGKAAEGPYAKAGVFSGTPDTFHADRQGLDFKWNDTVLAGEVGYCWGDPAHGSRVRLGGHYNKNGKFYRWSDGKKLDKNYVIYGAYKQTLWQQESGPSGVDLALTAFTAPANRNMAEIQGLLSLVYRAPFVSRPDDAVAFGIIGSRMSKDFAKSADIGRGTEMTYELSYTLKPAKWLLVQPDVQYIRNPMGNKSTKAAWVIGVRLQAVF